MIDADDNPYQSPQSDEPLAFPIESGELRGATANRVGTVFSMGFGVLFSLAMLGSLDGPIGVATSGFVFYGLLTAGLTVPHVRRMRKFVRPGSENMPAVCLAVGCLAPATLALLVLLKWQFWQQ